MLTMSSLIVVKKNNSNFTIKCITESELINIVIINLLFVMPHLATLALKYLQLHPVSLYSAWAAHCTWHIACECLYMHQLFCRQECSPGIITMSLCSYYSLDLTFSMPSISSSTSLILCSIFSTAFTITSISKEVGSSASPSYDKFTKIRKLIPTKAKILYIPPFQFHTS